MVYIDYNFPFHHKEKTKDIQVTHIMIRNFI